MNLRQHEKREDMMVFLSMDEADTLLKHTKATEHRIAIGLGVRSGLRSHEVLDVAPKDLVETQMGDMLRIHHGKGDQYRETPVPATLAATIRAADDMREQPNTAPIISATTTRTLRRWVKKAARRAQDVTDDEGWQHLSFHDLRKTWATNLRNSDVDAMVALEWGGWNDLETFLDHYMGAYTPDAQRREREKVDWL